MDVATGWTWPSLHDGQRQVLLDVLVHGARSRADLARRAGLSRTSLTRLTRDLVSFGFVAEGETTSLPGRGRPAEMLHIVPSSAHLIGIKLTGDALYAVVIDLAARPVLEREVTLTSRSVEDVVALIGRVVTLLCSEIPRVAAIGVCLAGDVRIDHNGKASVVGSHFLGWADAALQSLVESATGLPASISNDVQALTIGHHWFGEGAGMDSVAVIGYGEGIGAGMVVNGDLVRGAHGHPGKIGHLHVGDYDAECDNGHRGCVSALAPIPKILRAAGASDLPSVLERDRRGDPVAVAALDGAAEALAAVVGHLANVVDPRRIIVTGEGIPVARARAREIEVATAERLDPAATAPDAAIVDFRFEDYARGAAVGALQSLIV